MRRRTFLASIHLPYFSMGLFLPSKVKSADVAESFSELASEFGWQFSDPDRSDIDELHDSYMMRHVLTGKHHIFLVRVRRYERGHLSFDMPLREQFVVATFEVKARTACDKDTIRRWA